MAGAYRRQATDRTAARWGTYSRVSDDSQWM